jgi:hypothetical protein
LLLKFDPALRWWSILTAAAASFSMGQIVGELDAIGYAQQNFPKCELPMISKSVFPHIDSFGVYGSLLAVLIVVAALVGFRILRTEETRYRLVTAINIAAWPIVLLGVSTFFLAAYALPYAKCAAAA